MLMEDARIIQLYWDRDEQAIPATADKYGSYCTSIAQNILGSYEEAGFIIDLESYKKSLIYEVVTGKRRVC